MNGLRRLHRALTALQKRLWVRVLCTLLAIAGASAYFVPLLTTSYTYDTAARGIVNALAGPEGDRFADTLRESGSVKIDGVVRRIKEVDHWRQRRPKTVAAVSGRWTIMHDRRSHHSERTITSCNNHGKIELLCQDEDSEQWQTLNTT